VQIKIATLAIVIKTHTHLHTLSHTYTFTLTHTHIFQNRDAVMHGFRQASKTGLFSTSRSILFSLSLSTRTHTHNTRTNTHTYPYLYAQTHTSLSWRRYRSHTYTLKKPKLSQMLFLPFPARAEVDAKVFESKEGREEGRHQLIPCTCLYAYCTEQVDKFWLQINLTIPNTWSEFYFAILM